MAIKKKKPTFEDPTIVATDYTYQSEMKNAESLSATLVLLIGPRDSVGEQWSLSKEEVILGRSPENEINILDRSVSRQHIKFSVVADKIYLESISSNSPVLVNQETIDVGVKIQLQDGDLIKLGHILLKFFAKGNPEALTVSKAHEKSYKDPLTGAYNRRGLDFKMALEKNLDSWCCIFFDLDHFKKTNDTFGHSAGDLVLELVSKAVSNKVIRKEDVFVRYGGEEFCLFIPNSSKDKCIEIAERLRLVIEREKFEHDGKQIPVTVSVGACMITGSDWKAAMSKADKALYKSKEEGRNKVTYAD